MTYSTPIRPLLVAAAIAAIGLARPAHACDDKNPEHYRSDKTVWCVDPQVWTDHSADVSKFFTYGDKIIVQLEETFGITPQGLPFTIVAKAPDHFAQTPSRYGPGEEVTGDAYWNESFGITGFYGYLLTLHELVNQWTGLVSGGWPTDWWADHRSPFPNSMDAHIMDAVGMTDVAKAQSKRFNDPGSGDYDAEVGMFDDIFNIYGFDGYRQAFSLVKQDNLDWDALGDNPSELRSEYVIAYLSLPAHKDLSPGMVKAGVGGKTQGFNDPQYPVSAQVIGDIADAHCAIAAAAAAKASGVDQARGSLKKGDYKGAAAIGHDGDCTTCPGECACRSGSNRCVAPWRGDVQIVSDMGAVSTGVGGIGNSGSGGGASQPPPAGHSGCNCALGGAAGAGSPLAAIAILTSLLAWLWLRRRAAVR
jgi:hypothetical protein